MKEGLEQKQKQQLALTESMQQSLKILSMSSYELHGFLTDFAYSNPVIDMDSVFCEKMPSTMENEPFLTFSAMDSSRSFKADKIMDQEDDSFENIYSEESNITLESVLLEQLDELDLDKRFYSTCKYLIMCLNDRGYLDIPPKDIADELGVDYADVMQALYAVQSFSPCGVGARDLNECLLLQLAQTKHFNADTVHLIKHGLPLLAQNNMSALVQKLGISRERVKKACSVVRSLNPIPSSGFISNSPTPYLIPDAFVFNQNGKIVVELNFSAYPRIKISKLYSDYEYEDYEYDKRLKEYLDKQTRLAQNVINALNKRDATLATVLKVIIAWQSDYFKNNGALVPMAMKDIASELGITISTVSRTINDKYLYCSYGIISIKSLFSNGVVSTEKSSVSPDYIKRKIVEFVENESKTSPLSDEDIRIALNIQGISISRRTVAKYREELSIPNSSRRKLSF